MRIKKISVRDYQLSNTTFSDLISQELCSRQWVKLVNRSQEKKELTSFTMLVEAPGILFWVFFALNRKLSSLCQDSSVSQTQIKKATEYSITFVFSRGNDKIKILLAKREVSWSWKKKGAWGTKHEAVTSYLMVY